MIVKRQTHVKLKKTYTKILYLCEAMKETFVFVGMKGYRGDCIVHVDKYGKQLFCHKFDKPIDTMIMMTQFQAALIQTRANVITILDLNTHQFKRIPHYFMNEQSDQSYLWSFPETKYMAVIEHGRYNDNRIRITYYNYPQTNPTEGKDKHLIHHQAQLLQHVFEDSDGKWNFQHQIVKGNNHSMVLWYRARHDKLFQFRFYRRNKDIPLGSVTSPWQFKVITIDHKFQSLYNIQAFSIAVLQVFELETDKLFVNCITNREYIVQREKEKFHDEEDWFSVNRNKLKTINSKGQKSRDQWKKYTNLVANSYVVELNSRKVTQSPHNLGKYHPYQIDHHLLGSCHMIRTFQFINGSAQKTPVVYYSNTTFQPIFEQQWTCSYKTKYFFPGYDAFAMLENEYENGGDITEFKCTYKKLIVYKEMLVFFMLEMNEDFDDDLLQDVVEMICDK